MTEDKRAPSTFRHLDRVQPVDSAETAERTGMDNPSLSQRPVVASPRHTDSQRASATDMMRPPPPLRDVIQDAFQDTSPKTDIAPELIKAVTEQVIKYFAQQQAAGSDPLAASPSLQTTPPLPFLGPMSPTESFPPQNTPPTPDQRSESRWSNELPSPELATSDAGSQFSQHSRGVPSSPQLSNRSKSPTHLQPSPAANVSHESRDTELPRQSAAQRPSRADSKVSNASKDESVANATRQGQDQEETALERAWQPLFNDGIPTARLGSLLRGLALHIIEESEPRGSLVITPSKMLRFFNETKVTEEHYPWHTIYSRLTHASLSTIYRSLGCQHHLVQRTNQEQPTVPGLTANGFECFMTGLILAHPDAEFERLAKAVTNMPISSADDRAHRFPKELSRRLLPFEPNIQAQQRLVSSMSHEASVMAELRGIIAMPPPPPPTLPPASHQSQATSFPDRPRQSYTQTSLTSGHMQNDDSAPSAIPIERERKPYIAKQRSGKLYDPKDNRPSLNQYNAESAGAGPSRSNSGLQSQGMFPSSSQPVDIPQRPPHRASMSQAPPSQGGYTRAARGQSSPPARNPYGNSDPFSVGSMSDQQFGTNLHPTQSNPVPVNYSEEGYNRPFHGQSRADRASISTSTVSNSNRGVSIPRRNANPGHSSGVTFGSMGGPVGDPPQATSHSSRRSMPPAPNAGPDRRRSLFNSASTSQHGGGDSGSDASGTHVDSMTGNYPPPPPRTQQYGPSSQY